MRNRSLLLALALATPAIAANRIDGFECVPDGLQQEQNVCAIEFYKAADREMNRQYKKSLATLPLATRPVLRKSQREWLKTREALCKSETLAQEGGNTWAVALYTCLGRATERRTQELKLVAGRR